MTRTYSKLARIGMVAGCLIILTAAAGIAGVAVILRDPDWIGMFDE